VGGGGDLKLSLGLRTEMEVYIQNSKSRIKVCRWEGVRHPTLLNSWTDLY